ncbi:MAG: DNA polymerase III subunit gamma/tau [Lyngbya sp.]|nr:DNA polymerase III subunit gamma/tau [Lyngbya sp.]
MTYEPLHHKYRPQTFADLVGQDAIATTLTNAIDRRRIVPAYLFTGPRGTGKTSSARILAKSLNCLSANEPTATPCGTCAVCRGIANGSTLDVIEIDAASNTGVDNIRELIERAQFAPVQCRYKVYVIDECLTGDSWVQTVEGLVRIDNPSLKGKRVLSYNEKSETWEYKKVLRWLDKGDRKIRVIKTKNSEIRCTGNHLLRTETGWIQAKDIKEGMKILSPVNVGAEHSFTNLERMAESENLSEGINFMEIPMAKNPITWQPSSNKQKLFSPSVSVGAEKNLMFPNFSSKKVKAFKVFNLIGKNIPIKKDMGFGKKERLTSWQNPQFYQPINLDLSTELYSEIVRSPIPIKIADFPGWHGHMDIGKKNGWNIKLFNSLTCVQNYELPPIKGTETYPFVVTPLAILNSKKSLVLLNQTARKSSFQLTGLTESTQKDSLGGIWMTEHSCLVPKEAQELTFVPRDSPVKKIKLLPTGSPQKDIRQSYNPIQKPSQLNFTTALPWTLKSQENGWQTFNNIPSLQWNTSLETVVSVEADGVAKVYDIEVEDNHNFVANGLLVHNCHMLSVAAFNALLKTLEEPPERVVFVLATTDPQRVLPTIISRCQRFDFRRIPLEPMVQHLQTIAQKEQIPITLEAVKMVAQIAQGGLRDAESLLDQLSLLAGEIDVERVWDLVGAVPERDLLELLKAIASENSTTVIDSVRQLLNRGREPLIVLQNLAEFYRDLLIAKTAPQRSDLVKLTQPTWEELCQFAHHWEIHTILAAQKHLRESETQIKNTTQPRLWLEIILLGLLPSALRQSTPSVESFPTQTSPQPRTISQPFVAASSPPKNSPSPAPLPSPEPPPQLSEKPVVEPSPTVAEQPSEPAPKIQENYPEETTTPSFSADTKEYDLEEIWRRVLEQVQPPATQALFRQHGRLLAMDTNVAYIGLPTQKLQKIAQGRIPNVEAAFQRVFNHPIKVRLEVGTQKKNTSPKASSPQQTENQQIENKPTVSPEPVVNPVQENPQSNEPLPATPQPELPVEPQFTTPTSPVEQSPEPPEIASQNPPFIDNQEITTPHHLEEDRLAVASRRLAEVFEGKVIKLSEQKDTGALNNFSRVTTEELSTFEPIVDPEEDKNDEEDVPF